MSKKDLKSWKSELKAYLRYCARTVEDDHDLAAIIRDLDRRLQSYYSERDKA